VTGQQPRDALLDVLHGPLSTRGLDLEGVEISTAGRKRLVRVLVDKDGGVTLDEIAELDGVISQVLEDSDVLGDHPYTLEVTSPGIDRPLTAPRHWRRNVDRLVKVHPVEGEPFVGRVVDATESHAVLDVEGAQQQVSYDDVAKARVEIEFNRPRTAGDAAGSRRG